MGYFCADHLTHAIEHYTGYAENSQVTVKQAFENNGTCGRCNEKGIWLVSYIPLTDGVFGKL